MTERVSLQDRLKLAIMAHPYDGAAAAEAFYASLTDEERQIAARALSASRPDRSSAYDLKSTA